MQVILMSRVILPRVRRWSYPQVGGATMEFIVEEQGRTSSLMLTVFYFYYTCALHEGLHNGLAFKYWWYVQIFISHNGLFHLHVYVNPSLNTEWKLSGLLFTYIPIYTCTCIFFPNWMNIIWHFIYINSFQHVSFLLFIFWWWGNWYWSRSTCNITFTTIN